MASTGVGAVASVAQSAFSVAKGVAGRAMGGVKQAVGGNTNDGGGSMATVSSSGPLQAGQSMKIPDADGQSSIATIKRNDANNFSIGKQSFQGDPNKPEALFNALAATHLSHADQATVRHAMSNRQEQSA